MRIAFVVWRFPVLSEPFILNQIAGLLDRGHDVQIFALNGAPDGDAKRHDIVDRYALMERTHLMKQLPRGSFGRLKTLAMRWIGPAFGNPRAAVKLLSQALSRECKTPLKMLNRSAWLLTAGGFDVVHCQFGTLAFPVMKFREAGLLQGRLVTHFRGVDITTYVKEQGRDAYAPVFEASDYFLANCGFFRDKAVALGCPPERIASHGSGINLSAFPMRPVPPIVDGVTQLIAAGRLVEKKGFRDAIQAVGALTRQGRQVRLQIIGEGPERTWLESLIDAQGLNQQVELLGWRNHTEMAELLRQAHIFLAPCVTAADGNQDAPVNTLKEAMATGLPVVATRHGGIPELVEEGHSGYLVPERDPAALAEAIGRLLDAPESWQHMANQGRIAVEAQYDMHRLNNELVEIYQCLTDQKTPIELPVAA